MAGSITHIDDADPLLVLKVLRDLQKCTITEKLDGYAMVLGYDDQGRFYTSRESKGGERFFNVQEYGSGAWATTFKAAHLGCQNNRELRRLLKNGDAIQVELLFGDQPNAVLYDQKGLNRIVVLQRFDGTPDMNGLKSVRTKASVTVPAPSTDDGITIQYERKTFIIQFDTVPSIPKEIIANALTKEVISGAMTLKEFLDKPAFGDIKNAEILSLPLNKRPESIPSGDFKVFKDQIKAAKTKAKEQATQIVLEIKEHLLQSIVHPIGSAFGPAPENGGFIEGVVIRHPDGEIIKLVDKNLFTSLNKWNHEGRTKISEIMDGTRSSVAHLIGHPALGAASSRKKYLETHPLKSITWSKDITEDKVLDIVQSGIISLKALHEQYLKSYKNFKHDLPISGVKRSFSYQGEVHSRTMMSFAEAFQDLLTNFKWIKKYHKHGILNACLPPRLQIPISECLFANPKTMVVDSLEHHYNDVLMERLEKPFLREVSVLPEELNADIDEMFDQIKFPLTDEANGTLEQIAERVLRSLNVDRNIHRIESRITTTAKDKPVEGSFTFTGDNFELLITVPPKMITNVQAGIEVQSWKDQFRAVVLHELVHLRQLVVADNKEKRKFQFLRPPETTQFDLPRELDAYSLQAAEELKSAFPDMRPINILRLSSDELKQASKAMEIFIDHLNLIDIKANSHYYRSDEHWKLKEFRQDTMNSFMKRLYQRLKG